MDDVGDLNSRDQNMSVWKVIAAERRERAEQVMDNLIDPAAVLAGSPDGILVLDTDGTIRFVNAPAEDLLGQRADELVGRHLDCSTIPDDTFPLRIIRPDGNEVVMEVRVVAAPWLGEAASVLWLRDLTLRGVANRPTPPSARSRDHPRSGQRDRAATKSDAYQHPVS